MCIRDRGDTGWLLPEKLNRDEAAYYLEHCRQAGDVYKRQSIGTTGIECGLELSGEDSIWLFILVLSSFMYVANAQQRNVPVSYTHLAPH